jgi:aldose 1-epimerase
MPEISLAFGSGSTATISSVGAALLELTIESKKLIARPADPLKIFAGSVLAPWQNRLAKGQWVDSRGQTHSLPINEPNLNNALHGMVYETEFFVREQTRSKVTLGTLLDSPAGYPYSVDIEIAYELDEFGLTCIFSARNESDTAAPFVIGFHPYFTVGNPDKVTLLIPAGSYYTQDGNKIPAAKTAVADTSFDFRSARPLIDAKLDDYFTDLTATEGQAVSRLETSDWALELRQSAALSHLVVYLTHQYDASGGQVSAIALEPASAPANALNSQDDLDYIEPGATFTGNWSVSLAAE